jgi:hypothetical protein
MEEDLQKVIKRPKRDRKDIDRSIADLERLLERQESSRRLSAESHPIRIVPSKGKRP